LITARCAIGSLPADERKSAFAGTKFIFSKWPKSRREFAGAAQIHECVHVSVRLRAADGGAPLSCGSLSAMAQSRIASVYGYSGGKTASGEKAHPTKVTVTNKRNGRSATVRINDRSASLRGGARPRLQRSCANRGHGFRRVGQRRAPPKRGSRWFSYRRGLSFCSELF
jgi:hypothetical protein